MIAFEYSGTFVPSILQQQLLMAGLPVLGLTCTEDDAGSVVAVQVICDDGADENAVSAAVSAYVPPPTPEEVAAAEAIAPATADDHRAVTDEHVTQNLAAVPIPRDQLQTIIVGMLQLSEQFIPKLQGAIANWSSLTAAQKDRILEDLANFALVQMQYTTGLLPTSPPSAPPA